MLFLSGFLDDALHRGLYKLRISSQVHVEQLLYRRPEHTSIAGSSANPAFFSGVSQFYSYQDSDTKWGLFNGFSSRPMMPIAIKMLLSKTRLKEDEELVRQLKVSKEDVRLLKLYNMLSVT